MTLSKEQLKEAKRFCKENSIDSTRVKKELGNGFWSEECNSTFEGYLNYLLNFKSSGVLEQMEKQSTANYRSGRSGLSHLTK